MQDTFLNLNCLMLSNIRLFQETSIYILHLHFIRTHILQEKLEIYPKTSSEVVWMIRITLRSCVEISCPQLVALFEGVWLGSTSLEEVCHWWWNLGGICLSLLHFFPCVSCLWLRIWPLGVLLLLPCLLFAIMLPNKTDSYSYGTINPNKCLVKQPFLVYQKKDY